PFLPSEILLRRRDERSRPPGLTPSSRLRTLRRQEAFLTNSCPLGVPDPGFPGGSEQTSERIITTGRPSLLRAMNERAVLELIRNRGRLSRAQVARDTGLSEPTVSVLLSALLEDGLVHEVGRSTGGRGPSAALYELNPNAGWVVGIDVGRRWVRAGIADIAGAIVARRDERARVRSAQTLIGQIGRIAHELAGEAGLDWTQVTHAALGTPGVFDPVRGLVQMAPNLPGWGRHGIVEAVHEE